MQKSPGAALALAHYGKDSDVSIIQSIQAERAAEFYEAVQVFPHEDFKDDLEDSYDSIMAPKYLYYRTEYFAAIASYRDDWARSMLRRPYRIHFFQDPDAARASVMYAISMEHQLPYYTELIWEFSDSQSISANTFKQLCESVSIQCTNYVTNTLAHIKDLDLTFSWDKVRAYTDYLKRNDPELLKKIIIEQLESGEMALPAPYLGIIKESKDPDYVNPALEFIQEKPEHWSKRDLAIVLLDYGDISIKERLLRLRPGKRFLHSKEFQKALENWKPGSER